MSLTNALSVSLADLLRRRNTKLSFVHGDFRKSASMGLAEQELVRESVEEYFGRFYDVLASRIVPERSELFEKLMYRAVCEEDMSIQRAVEFLRRTYEEIAHECELCGV